MIRSSVALVLALLSQGCLATYHQRQLVRLRPVGAEGLLFHDVRVFAATSESASEHQDVYVRQGRIAAIGPTGQPVPAGAELVDGRGKTLLPGLVDFHGHLTGTASPPWQLAWPDPDHVGQSYLYCGVTSVYDVAGDLAELARLRKREASGDWVGPRFTYSGQMVTPAGGYPASMVRDLFWWPLSSIAVGHFATEISTAKDADEVVRVRSEQGADHVKVAVAQIPLGSPVFDPGLLRAVVEAAHRRGMKVVAHVDTEAHALLAARAGVDVLVHLVQLGPLSAETARELAERKVPVALTLVAFERMEQIKLLRYQPTPIERELNPPEMLAPYSPEAVAKVHVSKGMDEWVGALLASHDERPRSVRRLLDAGVELLVGSDGEGSAATWAGGAYLDELRLMVQAGVPAPQVLLAATSRPARLMMPGADFGTVEVGKRADLLLVDGNPLEDVDIAERIAMVMQNGNVVERMKSARASP